ncbi:hypothetical protein DSECCO2_630570 [anaerobic digester metagenome]
MKKTFALVLAVAMVMSLAAVSFAADPSFKFKALDSAFNTKDSQAYHYDGDDNTMRIAVIQYGKSAFFPIVFEDESGAPVYAQNYSLVEKLKLKAKWEMGSEIVESISIVKKYVDISDADNKLPVPVSGYYYFVQVKLVAKETTADTDVVGTLTFNQKADKDEHILKADDVDIDISFNVNTEYSYKEAKWMTVDGDVDLRYDRAYVLKYSAEIDDEIEIAFGGADSKSGSSAQNEGTFTVDVSGQGKQYFHCTTIANDAIAAANPNAKLYFLNFNNVKFNRTGEFAYEMENGAYAYQIVDGKLVAIPGYEYDEADETFYFNTRVLGSYVFSDVELVDAPAAVEAPAVEAPVVENPTTGAAA